MNKLDENKIYYLGDLNKEQAGELFDYIKTVGVNNGWDDRGIFISSDIHLGVLLYFNGNSWTWNYDKNAPTTNALELFYNLDNIQVAYKSGKKSIKKEPKPSKYNIGIDAFDRCGANITKEEIFNPQKHYDNSKGSLYKLADELNLNHWEFDILKRLVRCRKKGQLVEDLNKIKDTIDIYILEYKE